MVQGEECLFEQIWCKSLNISLETILFTHLKNLLHNMHFTFTCKNLSG